MLKENYDPGFIRRDELNHGDQFELVKVDKFDGYKNPGEEEYEFNIGEIVRAS